MKYAVSLDASNFDHTTAPGRYCLVAEEIAGLYAPGDIGWRAAWYLGLLSIWPIIVLPDGVPIHRNHPGGTVTGTKHTNFGHTVQLSSLFQKTSYRVVLCTGDDIILASRYQIPQVAELSKQFGITFKEEGRAVVSKGAWVQASGHFSFCAVTMFDQVPVKPLKMVVRAAFSSPTLERFAALVYELRHHPDRERYMAALARVGWDPKDTE